MGDATFELAARPLEPESTRCVEAGAQRDAFKLGVDLLAGALFGVVV